MVHGELTLLPCFEEFVNYKADLSPCLHIQGDNKLICYCYFRIGDLDSGFAIGNLGLGLGIWDWGSGLGIRNRDLELELEIRIGD